MTIELPTREWASVADGERLDTLTVRVTLRKLIIDVAGTRDLYPIHHDRDFAKANGARDIFVNTMFYEALFGRIATDWAGPEAFLRKLAFTMRSPNCLGDTITSRAWVLQKHEATGEKLVDLEVRLDNQLESDVTVAQMSVQLPK
jgi:acyl dehydratase